MIQSIRIELSFYEGPNTHMDCPAIVGQFALPSAIRSFSAEEALHSLHKILPARLLQQMTLPLANGSFETVASALAKAMRDGNDPNGLPVTSEIIENGVCRIAMGFHDAYGTRLALQTGIDIARIMFAPSGITASNLQRLRTQIQQAMALIATYQPNPLARSLLRVAKRRGIPVYTIAPTGAQTCVYGQGRAGVQFFESASQYDSLVGFLLEKNKYSSNVLVTSLGLPGVQHVVANTPETARRFVKEMGFPIVIKPLKGEKGEGVTVNITNDAELIKAFTKAKANHNPSEVVLIEKQVDGDDHRLAVVGGKFVWAIRRSPPRIIADGTHTIAELVAMENDRRQHSSSAEIASAPIVVNAETVALLQRQRLSIHSKPAAGRSVMLGSVANLARGGTRTDVTDRIHPDNRDLAETIARAFRLDTAGIDFMTTDITRSWQEGSCAVIEVNAIPGFSSDDRAEIILDAKFPKANDGRIPTIVVIGAELPVLDKIANMLAADGRIIGVTDGNNTRLGEHIRFHKPASLPTRTKALILDPACEALLIGITSQEIERHGFPLDRCDLAVVIGDISESLAHLVTSCAGTIHRLSTARSITKVIQPAIKRILSARAKI